MKNEFNTIQISDNPNLNIEKYFNIEPFFSLSHDYLCIAGFDGYFRKINPAFIKLMGYTREELFASPISHFVHPQDKLNTAETQAKILEGVPLLHFQNRYITKNGEIVWLTWTSIPVPDEDTLQYIELLKTATFQLKNTINKNIDVLNADDKLNVKLEKVNLKNTLNNTLVPLK